MKSVQEVANELREAIAGHSFEHAGELLQEYVRASLAAADQPAIGEAAELLAGLRRQALAGRAHLAARLDELNRLGPYLKTAPPRRRVQVEG